MISGRLRTWVERSFTAEIDGRPLAVFRILLALLYLKDALYHFALIDPMYTPDGILPAAVAQATDHGLRFSPLDFTVNTQQVVLFFVVWVVVILVWLVGWKTRWLTVIHWLFALAVYERNTGVINGADQIMLILNFWMIFARPGQHYSLDAWLARQRGEPLSPTIPAFPVHMMQLQIAVLYAFTGLLKATGEVWRDGSALSYILSLQDFITPIGTWTLANLPPLLLRLFTWGTMLIEIGFPMLAFAPVGQPWLRRLALLGGFGLHLGIGLTMYVPDFSIIMVLSYLLFIEPVGGVSQRVPAPTRRRLLFSGLALTMLGVFWINLATLNIGVSERGFTYPLPPKPLDQLFGLLELEQDWSLFSPSPGTINAWVRIPGHFADGSALDLLTGRPPDTEPFLTTFGPVTRWRKYTELAQTGEVELLDAWLDYYCRRYASTENPLEYLDMRWRWQEITFPGEPASLFQEDVIFDRDCRDPGPVFP